MSAREQTSAAYCDGLRSPAQSLRTSPQGAGKFPRTPTKDGRRVEAGRLTVRYHTDGPSAFDLSPNSRVISRQIDSGRASGLIQASEGPNF